MRVKLLALFFLLAAIFAILSACSGGNTDGDPISGGGPTDAAEPTGDSIKPDIPPVTVTKVKLMSGAWTIYHVKAQDGSFEFYDPVITMSLDEARANMLRQTEELNRIAASNKNVNVFLFIPTALQNTDYFNEVIPASYEPSTKDLLDEFIGGLEGLAGVDCLDISTLEKRIEYYFNTDHHWCARGVYQSYTQIHAMMKKAIPDLSDLCKLNGYIQFPGVKHRGATVDRAQVRCEPDDFEVMDIVLPRQHPTERVYYNLLRDKTTLNDNIRWDSNKYYTQDLYNQFYSTLDNMDRKYTFPDNKTGRKLLIIGDSMSDWIAWLIAAHFDSTWVYRTHINWKPLDYTDFVRKNNITDVLIVQSSHRTVFRSAQGNMYLEMITTK